MSKARLVITAVIVEGRSQSEVARTYGISQGWISRLITRYRRDGDAAFEPRSRRPHTNPTRLPQATIDLIIALRTELAGKGLDHGPHTIGWHLRHHHGLNLSISTIHCHLGAAGLIDPALQKRPKSSYIRFAADQPNERWQADFTHWWLADSTHAEILDWLDDHARYALSVTAHRRVTGDIVLTEFRKTVAAHGIPYSTLTDNGMVFTTPVAQSAYHRLPAAAADVHTDIIANKATQRAWRWSTQGHTSGTVTGACIQSVYTALIHEEV